MRGPVVLLVLLALLLAGCTGGTGKGGSSSPTTSAMMNPPAPKQVFLKEVDQCPPNAPSTSPTITEKFTVPDGYDQLVITWHSSGVGNVSGSVRSVEGNTMLFSKSENVNSMCGAHSHEGNGTVKAIEPGEFEARVSWVGVVGIHFDITARSSLNPGNMTMQHEHP